MVNKKSRAEAFFIPETLLFYTFCHIDGHYLCREIEIGMCNEYKSVAGLAKRRDKGCHSNIMVGETQKR